MSSSLRSLVLSFITLDSFDAVSWEHRTEYRSILSKPDVTSTEVPSVQLEGLPDNISKSTWVSDVPQAETPASVSRVETETLGECLHSASRGDAEKLDELDRYPPLIITKTVANNVDGETTIKCHAKLSGINLEVQFESSGEATSEVHDTRCLYRFGIRNGTAFAYESASQTLNTESFQPCDRATVNKAVFEAYHLLQDIVKKNVTEAESGQASHRGPFLTEDMLTASWLFVWAWVQKIWDYYDRSPSFFPWNAAH